MDGSLRASVPRLSLGRVTARACRRSPGVQIADAYSPRQRSCGHALARVRCLGRNPRSAAAAGVSRRTRVWARRFQPLQPSHRVLALKQGEPPIRALGGWHSCTRWTQCVGQRGPVGARRLFQFSQRYKLNPIAGGDPFEHRKRIRRVTRVIGERDDAGVLGTESVAVYLKMSPRRGGPDDLPGGLPPRPFMPTRARASPRVKPTNTGAFRRGMLGCPLEHPSAPVPRPLKSQAVTGFAVAAGGINSRQPWSPSGENRP
jgi:hypothetical protein